jgi:exodeoxyribonuclease V alpha subunit
VNRRSLAYARGDKVIQRINSCDKEIFNGDIGVISAIDLEEGLLQITFEERIVDYEFNELDEIDLAYATSIHKDQVSEYPAVVIPMAMLYFMLLERNLPDTGVT